MKVKTFMIAALAAAVGFVSCSKENDNGGGKGNDGDGRVAIRIVDGNDVVRSEAAPGTTTKVKLNSGWVVFADDLDVIVKKTRIMTGSYPASPSDAERLAKENGSKVWVADLSNVAGTDIPNVPGRAKSVYIAGNLPAAITAVPDNIADFKRLTVDFASQTIKTGQTVGAVGSTDNVTLYGDKAVLTDAGDNTKAATVSLNAVGARVEINKISYDATKSVLREFQIDGIFINNYYKEMSLSSAVSAGTAYNTPADNAASVIMFKEGSAQYPSVTPDLSEVLYEYKAAGLGETATKLTYKPADGKVWAYNVIAPKTTTVVDGALTNPHIVIRLSGIKAVGDDPLADPTPVVRYPGTQFLTVTEFYDKDNGNAKIEYFQPGVIYYVTDLVFDESHLDEVPERAKIKAHVTLNMMTWERSEVGVGFN